MKVGLIFGTRPEIIKLAPVILELQNQGVDFFLVHTGQHYSENMDAIFWSYFGLPKIQYQLRVRQKMHAKQTSEMLTQIEDILIQEKPDWVLVQGDTNSTLSGALAASKIPGIRIAHVEAGLRSFDRSMPEEVNRNIVDHISDLLLVPTTQAQKYLLQEGIPARKIVVTGNTIEDVLLQNIRRAESSSSILKTFNLENQKYLLMTVHRQENTENEKRLVQILLACFEGAKKHQLSVVFPLHPRTKDRLLRAHFQFPNHVMTIDPQGYGDFLVLEKNARLLATDSGGVQEEACILKVPCITLRENTERPETIEIGANFLAGTNPQIIVEVFSKALSQSLNWESPYGGGFASRRIVAELLSQNGTQKTA